jgi:hypothetical protein
MRLPLIVLSLLLCSSAVGRAQSAVGDQVAPTSPVASPPASSAPAVTSAAPGQPEELEAADTETETEATPTTTGSNLDQFGFGAGIGVAYSLGGEIAADAEVENGVVRMKSKARGAPGAWLETHYTFGSDYVTYRCLAPKCLVQDLQGNLKEVVAGKTFFRPRRVFHGPFLAVNVDNSKSFLFRGIGVGYMLSLRRNDNGKPGSMHFNLGLGMSLIRGQELSGGLKDGERRIYSLRC